MVSRCERRHRNLLASPKIYRHGKGMHDVLENGAPVGPIRVAVCVATFRRPRPLETLLGALSQLSFAKVPAPAIQIIVVDNDATQSAEPVCRRLANSPWLIRYECEPQRGIARV